MVTLVSSSGKSISPPADHVGEEGHISAGAGSDSLAAITEPKLTQSQPRIVQSGLLARYVNTLIHVSC